MGDLEPLSSVKRHGVQGVSAWTLRSGCLFKSAGTVPRWRRDEMREREEGQDRDGCDHATLIRTVALSDASPRQMRGSPANEQGAGAPFDHPIWGINPRVRVVQTSPVPQSYPRSADFPLALSEAVRSGKLLGRDSQGMSRARGRHCTGTCRSCYCRLSRRLSQYHAASSLEGVHRKQPELRSLGCRI